MAISFGAPKRFTELRLEQRGVPTAEDRDDFAQAWPSVLAILAERIGG